jgi:cholesterol oxidase
MLANNWAARRPSYDFVIVGSGYGGAITAARIATANLNPKPSVCILERGKEWPVGTFPDSLDRAIRENRNDFNPLGLYELLTYNDISVIKGSGLGGTSLVNANVAIVPDEEAFQRSAWPASLNRAALAPYYTRARQTLDARPHPRAMQLNKVRALAVRATEMNRQVEPLDLAVNFHIDGVNAHGMAQVPCNDCGDCVSGCNFGAKNTLYMNYLPMARNAGAEIYTQTRVDHVEKLASGGWRIHGRHFESPLKSKKFSLDAANVILAAGSINTTEILLLGDQGPEGVAAAGLRLHRQRGLLRACLQRQFPRRRHRPRSNGAESRRLHAAGADDCRVDPLQRRSGGGPHHHRGSFVPERLCHRRPRRLRRLARARYGYG